MSTQSRIQTNGTLQRSVGADVSTGILQRKCASCNTHTIAGDKCEDCKNEKGVLQRKSSNHPGSPEVPPIVHEVLNTSGRPLDESPRAFFEPRFGHNFSSVPVNSAPPQISHSRLTIGEPADVYEQEADRVADSVTTKEKPENKSLSTNEDAKFDLSGVRIHTDARAAESARAVNALAYTVGNSIVFGAGQFEPQTHKGRRLIAHELTHVMQQIGKNNIPSLQRAGPGSEENVPKQRTTGLTEAEITKLNEIRSRLIPAGERSTSIVGVLIAEDGREFELKSGGGQGFSKHVEGKATAKMEELGITKATLLVEKEPCQICDRSVYSQETGPEEPMKSSRTGKDIDRQTPKINTALRRGTELTVVDPHSASLYRGVKPAPAIGTVPPTGGGPEKKPATSTAGRSPSAAPKPGASPAAPAPTSNVAETPAAPRTTPAPAPAPRVGTATGGVKAVTEGATSEARLAARAAAKEISAGAKTLRFARGFTAALHVVGFIGALSMLDTFTTMTVNSMSGKGFILTKEIADAERLESRASVLRRDYFPFSEGLTEMQLYFYRATQDSLSAGEAASAISDLDTQLDFLHEDLPAQIARVDAAMKEARAKQKAAEAILSDPTASAALAIMTFGTAELAMLFAASQDMSRIAGALSTASVDLKAVKNQVDEDFMFIHTWFEELFDICRKGGHCSLTVIEIPFIGTSRIHGLPGEAE